MNSAIAHYWEQSDSFGHAITILLLLMSLLSWSLILSKSWSFWRVRRTARQLPQFWRAPSWQDALNGLNHVDSEGIYASLAQAAADANDPQQRAAAFTANAEAAQAVMRALRAQLQVLTTRLENGLTLLASIGATAPFVGLLGTVWGIFHALTAISTSGHVQIDQLAGPVGEALIMTAFGLMVAIPAVLAFNALHRVNRITLAELDGFAHDLQTHLHPPGNR